jgi:hypothetical protein
VPANRLCLCCLFLPPWLNSFNAAAAAVVVVVVAIPGWNASDVDSWFAGIVKVGVADRTLQQLRSNISTLVTVLGDARDVDNRLRSMPATHVAFLACVAAVESEKATGGSVGTIFEYLGTGCRPEGAGSGVLRYEMCVLRCVVLGTFAVRPHDMLVLLCCPDVSGPGIECTAHGASGEEGREGGGDPSELVCVLRLGLSSPEPQMTRRPTAPSCLCWQLLGMRPSPCSFEPCMPWAGPTNVNTSLKKRLCMSGTGAAPLFDGHLHDSVSLPLSAVCASCPSLWCHSLTVCLCLRLLLLWTLLEQVLDRVGHQSHGPCSQQCRWHAGCPRGRLPAPPVEQRVHRGHV